MKSSELTYNAALNRPAYQISLYSNSLGTYPPNLANDGSRHTIYNTGSKCAVAKRHTNPWWAVDLGRPTTVYRVYFTNIDHTTGSMCLATILVFFLLLILQIFSLTCFCKIFFILSTFNYWRFSARLNNIDKAVQQGRIPQRGSGQSPGRKSIFDIFGAQERHLMARI